MNIFTKWSLVAGLVVGGAMPTTAEQVNLPEISGPIAVTPESGEAYRGSNEQPVAGPGLPMPDLEALDYMQEEYIVSGLVDGKLYRTSILVRKPKDMKRFSGLVGVETIHAAGAIPFWGTGREVWAVGGHGWVAVASQRAALEHQVKKFNPSRYAGLRIPELTAARDNMASSPQDRISQAIMVQVGALLKSNSSQGPFAHSRVKYLLMGGASQTGGTTLRFIQQSHIAARMPNGEPIYDGYLPMEAFSTAAITGGDAAVIHAVGEGDFPLFRLGRPSLQYSMREDSDTLNDRFRRYEFAGASHVPTRGKAENDRLGEYPSQFPNAPFYKMALLHLIDWVTKSIVPPRGQRLQQDGSGEMVRDEHGNVIGGIRSPWVDVPTAKIIASPTLVAGDPHSRAHRGIQENFSRQKLRQLYKTRENYLRKFNSSIDQVVFDGWITPSDGEKLKSEEAFKSPF